MKRFTDMSYTAFYHSGLLSEIENLYNFVKPDFSEVIY